MTGQKKPKSKKEPYKDELAKTARQSLVTLATYLIQAGIFALASFALSFYKLSGLVDLAVVLLFVRDIINLPEKAPKTKVALNRMVQALVIFGISIAFNDTLGAIASGLLAFFLGLLLFERFGEWLDRKLKQLDRWLSKKGLQ